MNGWFALGNGEFDAYADAYDGFWIAERFQYAVQTLISMRSRA